MASHLWSVEKPKPVGAGEADVATTGTDTELRPWKQIIEGIMEKGNSRPGDCGWREGMWLELGRMAGGGRRFAIGLKKAKNGGLQA